MNSSLFVRKQFCLYWENSRILNDPIPPLSEVPTHREPRAELLELNTSLALQPAGRKTGAHLGMETAETLSPHPPRAGRKDPILGLSLLLLFRETGMLMKTEISKFCCCYRHFLKVQSPSIHVIKCLLWTTGLKISYRYVYTSTQY